MKVLFLLLVFISGLKSFSQEIGFCTSLSTSSEQRLQNAYGLGLQYRQALGTKFAIELALHYNFKNSSFDHVPYIDGDPNRILIHEIYSKSQRFSLRLNFQGFLRNTNDVSISLGPEFSYNYLWGKDQIDQFEGDRINALHFSENIDLAKNPGIGLISSIVVKHFIAAPVSLYFTIRPEFLIGKDMFAKGGEPIFSSGLGFTEFQIGLNFRLHQ